MAERRLATQYRRFEPLYDKSLQALIHDIISSGIKAYNPDLAPLNSATKHDVMSAGKRTIAESEAAGMTVMKIKPSTMHWSGEGAGLPVRYI